MDHKKIVIERLKILREAQKKNREESKEIMRRDNIMESLSVLEERQKKFTAINLSCFWMVCLIVVIIIKVFWCF